MDNKLMNQMKDFMRLSGGFRASRVILTANNYAIFEYLKTPLTANELSMKIKTDARATEILLDAVTALGLLKKTGVLYKNASPANKFLLKGSPWYQGDMLRHSDALWKSWSGLDEVVKTGLPYRAGGRDHESFIRAMHNNAVFRAKNVLNAIELTGVRKALDLGGGPGTYSMELARHGILVTLFDLPDTIDIAKQIVKASRIKGIEFIAGDYHSDDIGNGYDLALISQILHSLSKDDNLSLLEKSRDALNPKGRIAIHEFFLDKNRAFPIPGALFSVNMLVNTAAGRSYTMHEMKTWLTKTGFKGIKTKVLGDTVVLTARKG
jgi:2-polyprenyl-3-methyl-5-hydroxy-6-metoxy-1,4-benzoquinol methylase